MSKILILNGTQPYPFAPGGLKATFVTRSKDWVEARGHDVRGTTVAEGYDAEEEVQNHLWADTVIQQFPVNWMGAPWVFKKYMDDVYTAGMDGRLCKGDGRAAETPKANYGMGGSLTGKTYMLSVTFNAPAESFDNPAESFFEGTSVDDLLRPQHLNAKFFGLSQLATFSAHDVMKNPTIETDLQRFDAHLAAQFGETSNVAA